MEERNTGSQRQAENFRDRETKTHKQKGRESRSEECLAHLSQALLSLCKWKLNSNKTSQQVGVLEN